MQIETFEHGPVQTNAYLVADEEAGEAWIIDAPPGSAADVLAAAREHEWRVVALLNTHGHWDHIADNAAIHTATGAPLSIHPADEPMIREPMRMGTIATDITPTTADSYLNDGDTRRLGRYTFTVWHTPGHSPGGVVLYEPTTGTLIGGDTLFPQWAGAHRHPRCECGGDASLPCPPRYPAARHDRLPRPRPAHHHRRGVALDDREVGSRQYNASIPTAYCLLPCCLLLFAVHTA